jgi:hypothetical protein
MKKLVESKNFAAFLLTSCEYSPEIMAATKALSGKAPGSPEYESARNALLDLLSADAKKQLATFGASLPSDPVKVCMDLGNLLFDVCKSTIKPVQTPLGQMIQQKKLQELAEIFGQDEFEIPEYAVPVIRQGLLDEASWAKVVVSAWAEVKDEFGETRKLYFTMKSNGALPFEEIMKSAAASVYNSELL